MSKNKDYKSSVILLKSARANNDYDIWGVLNIAWSSYTIVNSTKFDLETPYNRGWIKEGLSIDVYLLYDIKTDKYYWDTNYVSVKMTMEGGKP